jgi:hypothetical protein
MKSFVFASLVLSLIASVALAQDAPLLPKGSVKDADRIAIDETLQRYLSAYQHKSIQSLVDVWPGLVKEKKEYSKLKHHFEDASLSDEQMTLTPREVQSTADGVTVRMQRTEKFVKSESRSTLYGGDLLGGSPQSQAVPINNPVVSMKSRDIKKADEVWITMRRNGAQWIIVSIGDKKPPVPSTEPKP